MVRFFSRIVVCICAHVRLKQCTLCFLLCACTSKTKSMKRKRNSFQRCKEEVSRDAVVALVKKYVTEDPSLDTAWMSNDQDTTIKDNRFLLQDLGAQTQRINQSTLKHALLHIWPMNNDCADLWAAKLSKCFAACGSWAHHVRTQKSSGARMDHHMKSVVDAMLESTGDSPATAPKPLAPGAAKPQPSSSKQEFPSPSKKKLPFVVPEPSMWDSPCVKKEKTLCQDVMQLASPSGLWDSPVPVKKEERTAPLVKTEQASLACKLALHACIYT